jgi:flagellar basal-body rod protein FlgB
MDMLDLPLVSMLKQRMNWLGSRQTVLSQNVANADTPNYTASDLKPLDFEKALRTATAPVGNGISMTTTNPMHIPSPKRSAAYETHKVRDKETDPTGNSVSLEEEMIKVADTKSQYEAAANLYGKTLTMMKTAIGKSS